MSKYLIFIILVGVSYAIIDEVETETRNKKVMCCLSLVHSQFVNHNEKISVLIHESSEINKEIVYDKILYSSLVECEKRISKTEVDSIYSNLMDVQVLDGSSALKHIKIENLDKYSTFELNDEEVSLKNYIQDESLDVYQ